MTTGGNYLILLPSPPPCPSSNRIGVRRRYGGGGRGRGAFNIVGWESGNFFPPSSSPFSRVHPFPPKVRHTRIKHMRSVCTRSCNRERTEYLLPSPLSTCNETDVAFARCSLPPFSRKGSRIRVFAQVASRPAFDYVYSCIHTNRVYIYSSDVLRIVPNCRLIGPLPFQLSHFGLLRSLNFFTLVSPQDFQRFICRDYY